MAAEPFVLALAGGGVEQAGALRQLGEHLFDPSVPDRRVARSDPIGLRIERQEPSARLGFLLEQCPDQTEKSSKDSRTAWSYVAQGSLDPRSDRRHVTVLRPISRRTHRLIRSVDNATPAPDFSERTSFGNRGPASRPGHPSRATQAPPKGFAGS